MRYLRRIPLYNMLNLRDLGGYACDGGTTRFGVFFRSDVPASAEAARALRDTLGVTDVLDLRSVEEKQQVINGATQTESIRWHDLPLFDEMDPTLVYHDPDVLIKLYRNLLDTAGQAVKQVIETMIDAPGAALVHCSAGKDRTGIISMLLLDAVGVATEDIIADYEVSFSYMYPLFKKFMERDPDHANGILNSRRENMVVTLDYLRAEFGSAREYLLDQGIAEDALEALRAKFVIKNLD